MATRSTIHGFASEHPLFIYPLDETNENRSGLLFLVDDIFDGHVPGTSHRKDGSPRSERTRSRNTL